MSNLNTLNSGKTEGYICYRRWEVSIFGLKFRYKSDLIASDYMRRWVFETPIGMVRLHHILRSDDRTHFHDHPMDFSSLILRGAYIEYTPNAPPKIFTEGNVNVRKAEDMHNLELVSPTVWTLVFARPYRRDWGFQTEDGWIAASQYDAWKKRRDFLLGLGA